MEQEYFPGSWIDRRVALGVALISRPTDLFRWVSAVGDHRTPMQRKLPWISWGAIDQLDRQPLTGRRVLEYGGGGSSLYFLAKGCFVRTIEHDPSWTEHLERAVREMGQDASSRFELVSVAVRDEHDRDGIDKYIHAGASEHPWDVCLVDGAGGASRTSCVRAARDWMAPSAMFVVDDAYRASYAEIPTLLAGWRHARYQGVGPCRRGITRTDIYSRSS